MLQYCHSFASKTPNYLLTYSTETANKVYTWAKMRTAHLSNGYLKCCLWISEVGFVMLDGLISAVEAVSTAVAMPVSAFEFLLSLDHPHYVTMVTAAQNLQTWMTAFHATLNTHTHTYICILHMQKRKKEKKNEKKNNNKK